MADGEPVTIDVVGCARCHGAGHPSLTFLPFTHPVYTGGTVQFTHWAMCPTTREPILFARIPKGAQ